ncbi:MAG TPA: hypothetical protein VHE81_20200 [Lacipirellulaceae bacterium]|nr:hypothetical protein [Lacipirellulaceae bacterium]
MFAEADRLRAVAESNTVWEAYARDTFLAHAKHIPPSKLRYLQYCTKNTRSWWKSQIAAGAVLLEKIKEEDDASVALPKASVPAIAPGSATDTPFPKQVERMLSPKTAVETAAEPKQVFSPRFRSPDPHRVSAVKSRLNPDATLTAEEIEELAWQEEIVDVGIRASIFAARALHLINTYKDGAFWRSLNFETFQDYCLSRFGYAKSHAYRLTSAGKFVDNLEKSGVFANSPIGEWLPHNENQIRPILALPEDAQVTGWKKVVLKTPPAELTGTTVAKVIREYAKEKGISLQKPRQKTSEGSPKARAQRAVDQLNAAITSLSADQAKPFVELISQLELLVSSLPT